MKQCKACPWKKSTVPAEDIPGGYCAVKHANLRNTIAEPGAIVIGTLRAMACHETPEGRERECVGWLSHQLGPGNNIALRMRARDGRYDELELDGEQHETFEDTLKRKRKRKRKRSRGEKAKTRSGAVVRRAKLNKEDLKNVRIDALLGSPAIVRD